MIDAKPIYDAEVGQSDHRAAWLVKHRNGAIMAYCDTRAEAEAVREYINDMPRVLREMGMVVA